MFRENLLIKFYDRSIFVQFRLALAWVSVAFFTIYQMFLEMLTNTMTSSLMQSFNINHAQVGILSSSFFASFLIMQIPVGIILSRFNTKLVLSIACFCCGIGCVLFSHSLSVSMAIVSRVIMGGFAAFGFLGLLKISSMYYSSKVFPVLVGLSQFMVMSCTALGEPFIATMIRLSGWRYVLINAGYVAFIISIFIYTSGSCFSMSQVNKVNGNVLEEFIKLLKNKRLWLAGLYGFGMFSVIASFSALWGIEYLISVFGITFADAAFGISMNFWGVAFGSAIFGYLASKYDCGKLIRISSLLVLLFILSILLLRNLDTFQIYILLFSMGLFSGAFLLCFNIAKCTVAKCNEGIALSFCNIFVMSGTLLLQPFMGLVLDITNNQRYSMIVLIMTVLSAIVASNLMKNKQIN